MKEIYLQLVDGEGRELLRMTSALNIMPGESRSCAGCHESRMTASGSFTGRASRRPPTPLAPPEGLRAGVIDYMRAVQPVWNGHCVRCHGGADPSGGLSLEDGRTRFFCRSYDGLNARGKRDRWGEPDSERLAPWAVKYARTFARSCASCHGAFTPDRVSKYGDRRWEWVDLTRPDASPALVAHLPNSAGGRGLPANGKFSFSGRDDPRWKELRELFRAGAAFAAQTPEPDEAGFVPRSRGRLEYGMRLKRVNVNIQRD